MATVSPHHPEHSRVMRAYGAIDRGTERVLGADTRLLYGFEVPVLMVVGAIIALAFHTHWWLVAAILVLELVGVAVVVAGFVRMLGQDEDDESVG